MLIRSVLSVSIHNPSPGFWLQWRADSDQAVLGKAAISDRLMLDCAWRLLPDMAHAFYAFEVRVLRPEDGIV